MVIAVFNYRNKNHSTIITNNTFEQAISNVSYGARSIVYYSGSPNLVKISLTVLAKY